MSEGGRQRDSKRQFLAVLKLASEVYEARDRITTAKQAKDDGTGHKYRALGQMVDATSRSIASEKHLIEEALAKLENTLAARREAARSERRLPEQSRLRADFHTFFIEKQPVVPSPYAALCGALPFPDDQIIPNGSFVCAKNRNVKNREDGMYFLAYVFGFDPETVTYHVCDADPELEVLSDIVLNYDELVPMPTSVPARRTKVTSYALREEVLSLWWEESGGWTTVFYPAIVTSLPTTSPGFYGLRFDGDPPYVATIPERFVVRPPPAK